MYCTPRLHAEQLCSPHVAELLHASCVSQQSSSVIIQVKYCHVCQTRNKKLDQERPELHPIPIKAPWYHLGMDFIGPISPVSRSGNRYILTISDYFTRFGWAKALPTKEAKNVVQSLHEVSMIFSCLAYTCEGITRRSLCPLTCQTCFIMNFPAAFLLDGCTISSDDRPRKGVP